LLRLGESVANQSEGKFDLKACFFGVKLNGKIIDRLWLLHRDLVDGGVVEIEMGNTPNRKFGITNPPPSSLTVDPASLK
jgi:putative alpha-1,2-mannosidase